MVMKGEKRPLRKPPIPLLCVLLLLLGPVLPQRAAAEPLQLIRDAEIENTIRIYATPLFQAAGLSPQGIRLYLVKDRALNARSEEHTSELQSLMRISYAVFCLKKKKKQHTQTTKSNSSTH